MQWQGIRWCTYFCPLPRGNRRVSKGSRSAHLIWALLSRGVASSAMRMKLRVYEAVWNIREDTGFWGLRDLVSITVPPLPGCVIFHRCIYLSEPQFLHLINRNNSPYLRLVTRIEWANAFALEQHLTQHGKDWMMSKLSMTVTALTEAVGLQLGVTSYQKRFMSLNISHNQCNRKLK